MQRFLRWRTIGGLAVALWSMTAVMPAVAAQEAATPELSTDPALCVVEDPRTMEELQAIFGEPAPAGAAAATSAVEATPAGFTMPEGEPADEATMAAITEVVLLDIACFNAGHDLAAYSLVTDDFIASLAELGEFDEDFVATFSASPVPYPEEQRTQVLGVRDGVVLEDGRVAVLVDYFNAIAPIEGPDEYETGLWIFEQVEGEWLLDEVVANLEGTHGPDMSGTPAAG